MLPPAAVAERVSEFFALVQSAVERHGGTVRNVLTDTLVASCAGKGHAQKAVEAAKDVQDRFEGIEEAWKTQYGIQTSVALALHAGEVVIADGAIAGQPLFIGDSVSIAERLLHRARTGEVLLSKPVMDALRETGYKLDAKALPSLEILRRDPIPLFGLVRDTRLDFT